MQESTTPEETKEKTSTEVQESTTPEETEVTLSVPAEYFKDFV